MKTLLWRLFSTEYRLNLPLGVTQTKACHKWISHSRLTMFCQRNARISYSHKWSFGVLFGFSETPTSDAWLNEKRLISETVEFSFWKPNLSSHESCPAQLAATTKSINNFAMQSIASPKTPRLTTQQITSKSDLVFEKHWQWSSSGARLTFQSLRERARIKRGELMRWLEEMRSFAQQHWTLCQAPTN